MTVSTGRSRLDVVRHSLTRTEWLGVAGMFAVIAALHLVGWITLIVFVVPRNLDIGAQTLGIGVGLTAYTLGLRHAFDADHIAAIDNTTRKLMSDGQRPLSVGFFFSLGHATIVFGLAFLLSIGIRSIAGPVEDESSSLQHYTGLFGTTVSGAFLYLIALLNILVLIGILRVLRRMRAGDYAEADLEDQLARRGFVTRLLGPVMRAVTKPWHMYPVGLLFGLGFDTATEVALLVLAGTSAAAGLPWYAILCLPVLFAAGMSLLDTIDGTFMNFAYGWAFAHPVRKVYYNITVTALSITVALLIGTVELLGLLAEQLRLSGGFWDWVGGLDLNVLGYVIVGLFVATWVVALLVWRYGRVEQRWTRRSSVAHRPPSPPTR
ncbi:HoxN/HupN/NixA family nickel/cobalt transporter [Nocardia amikacinitolerans]|uniref:HoxN/HupN/NixA family nickel/cobalt transporter n=1 Tax=Nocardia amikacinitolerans TaxID=756689 RepID=UPI0020A4F2E7|nr:HoxN/HupN/NixA family nickel/cobalt transporter [Nocardia amikacinitolerans]MCP2289726.1 high-affinity nickel-transport protein [Nocardia amikacinitolerans]